MARNNDLVVTAGLNIEASVAQIEKDLKQVNDRLSADHALKIIANVDLSKTTQRINSQLATISKNLNLNIPKIELGMADGGGAALINNVSHIVDNVEDKIEELRKALAEKFKVGIDKIVTSTVKNASGQINSFSLDLTKLSGEVEKFNYKVSRTKDGNNVITSVKPTGSRDSDKGAIQLLERATKAANTLERQMINLKAAADDVSAPRPITSQESIDKVTQAYKNAETAVGNLRTANASTFEELNNVIKAQRNADTAATKLRAKPIEVVKADELSNLDKFVATISNSAIPDVTNLTQRVEELRSELSEVNDKQGLVDYLNKFANVESDFKALVAQAKAVKGALRDLDNLSNNSLFQKNKSNPQVSSTLSDIENIRKEYGQLFAEIGNAKTPEDLQKISNKIAELKPQFDKVTNSANQFKTALNLENIDAGRANRIKRLTADINSYAVANQRAVESTKKMTSGTTFADEWSRITTEMAKGADLTDRELKDLSADMAVFRKEAQAAGLAGESAFGKFLNSFKTMSSYITANMVFNFVKRQLRDMVNEVTAVDSAMVELRKVTEASDEEFEVLAKSAGKTGRELGASISDVINATSTFSRAGFDLPEAEKLGEIATLYKNVGDGIDIESASESLISVIKAFNIQADEYERIVDRINNVSNNFAIDSGGLGIALQRVSSAMDAANNSLDETIALTTVANEIVQNPEMVAQGWRTVALRIRGRITCLHIEKSICCA